MKHLRDYQSMAVDRTFEEWKTVRSTLVVAPTGSGKSRIAAEIIKNMLPKRSIFVAHRQELIWQARNAIDEVLGQPMCEIEMAELYAMHQENRDGPVVAMVQSLNTKNGWGRRMDRFNPDQFGLLVIDEFHHAVADSYRAVLGHFKRNPDLKVLGLTATPDRLDEEALGQICDSVAFDYEILDAINDGWLVPIEQVMVPVEGLDFSHIKTVAGDLNQSDLAAVMEAESVIQGVVQPTLELMFGIEPHTLDDHDPLKWGQLLGESGHKPKRTLIFTVSVAQAEMLSNVFNRVIDGISEWVCGKTADDKRVDLLQRYNDGEIAVMVNCNCLSEGFDSPGVEIIVQARPTKSRSLYAQQVGRATRPLPGIVDLRNTAELRKLAIASSAKATCTVVDFVGNSGRHKLISSVDILAGNVSDEAIELAKKSLCKSSTPVRVTDAIKDAEEELRLELEKRRREQEAKKARVVARSKYSIRFVNPFDALDIVPVKTRGWDKGKKISSKQAAVLERNRVDPGALSYAQARQVLNEIFARSRANQCSLGQANVLKRYHLPISVSRKQASAWLDELSKNRWCITNNLKQQQQTKVEEQVPF